MLKKYVVQTAEDMDGVDARLEQLISRVSSMGVPSHPADSELAEQLDEFLTAIRGEPCVTQADRRANFAGDWDGS